MSNTIKISISLLIVFFVVIKNTNFSQYGFGTNQPDSRSIIHVFSQDSTKGLIIPIVNNGTITPATELKGMIVYSPADSCLKICTGLDWRCLTDELNTYQYLSVSNAGGNSSRINLSNSTNAVTILGSGGISVSESNDSITLTAAGGGTDDQNLLILAGAPNSSVIDIEGGDSIIIQGAGNTSVTEIGNTITVTSTDDQIIDVFSLVGDSLNLSLENDSEATKVLDLSSINSDNQNLDSVLSVGNDANNRAINNVAQLSVGVASANSSAAVEISSTSQGFLISRMTQTQRDLIGLPATGLLVFQTDNTPGFYYYDGTAWQPLTSSVSSSGDSPCFTCDGF